jgi:hypothetical protein
VERVKGFKVFNPDWTCRDFKYEVGQTYETDNKISLCSHGFHFCQRAVDCFNHYGFNPANKVAEVDAIGKVENGNNKSVTNKIKIVREIPWSELLEIVNTGKGNAGLENTGDWNTGDSNTGHWNTGDRNTGDSNTGDSNTGDSNTGHSNTGDRNTGDSNTGDSNTGDWNTGDSNTGDSNTGHWNTGHWNTGHRNTGDRNTGDRNTGHRNTGDRNTGDWNTGDWNTGDWNTGDWNTGHSNTGDWNTGHSNTGDWNTGDWNTGQRNTGHWNTGHRNTGHSNTGDRNTGHSNTGQRNTGDFNGCDCSAGVFCTKTPKTLFFDKPSKMTLEEWRNSEAYYILLDLRLTEWVYSDDMTDDEKKAHPTHETTGGYLKSYTYQEAWKNLWDSLTDKGKKVVQKIPNFNKDKFNQITGLGI